MNNLQLMTGIITFSGTISVGLVAGDTSIQLILTAMKSANIVATLPTTDLTKHLLFGTAVGITLGSLFLWQKSAKLWIEEVVRPETPEEKVIEECGKVLASWTVAKMKSVRDRSDAPSLEPLPITKICSLVADIIHPVVETGAGATAVWITRWSQNRRNAVMS